MIRNIKHGEGIKSGIYKITNLINNKYYIGSTKHLSSRYRTHLSTLKANISSCVILQNAVNKYGIENFEFQVIEICLNYKEREIVMLNNDLPPYNCIKETKIRREISEITRNKMIQSRYKYYSLYPAKKGYKRDNFKVEKKSSLTLTSNEETLNYNSISIAAKELGCTIGALYNAFYRNTLVKRKYKIIIIKP